MYIYILPVFYKLYWTWIIFINCISRFSFACIEFGFSTVERMCYACYRYRYYLLSHLSIVPRRELWRIGFGRVTRIYLSSILDELIAQFLGSLIKSPPSLQSQNSISEYNSNNSIHGKPKTDLIVFHSSVRWSKSIGKEVQQVCAC